MDPRGVNDAASDTHQAPARQKQKKVASLAVVAPDDGAPVWIQEPVVADGNHLLGGLFDRMHKIA